MSREALTKASRIVVKLGTGILTDSRKQLDPERMSQLVSQIAALRQRGLEVVVVSSGAVGAGMGALAFDKRPTDLSNLQACAAVGQSRLMTMYEKLFARHGLHTAQVLLTHDDLEHHERHLNARNTLVTLLGHGVVPIINENDAVSFTELKFGDNDRLSALTACLLPADVLIILTSVDGVIENFGKPDARVLPLVHKIDANVQNISKGTLSAPSVGGMATKIEAAKIATRAGIPMVIASGLREGTLERVIHGGEEGTLFAASTTKLRGRKRWIAFFHHPRGTLFVDEGAKKALRENGKSLLPPGIKRCEGGFDKGDVVRICDENGLEFARGIAEFDADDIRSGQPARTEVVHRDDLVIL